MKTRDLLESLYRQVSDVILKRQHPVTGLLPASTAITTHGDYTDAWVRDNVYSIICVWSLGLAFRRHGNDCRSDELEQCTIKLMRGLLQSMMRQSNKVETFKSTLAPHDALHAKYDTATGLPVVADDAWGHLQIDATSIFLLMIGQMSASGYRIVRTYSEVDFVQNLIYYVASAYRTPDFGIWERGNKINNGKTEINASSVGMAKAALQALDGFNLFGKNGPSRAVLHTVADSISQARNVLASLLPRESLSKEVDSALLSVIGFPAFAVGDQDLKTKTRDEILKKLGGSYGCKRFLWDGHQTAVEESSRIYYERSELASFENVESEWPLFFSYLYINALFERNTATARYYRHKLESIMVEQDGYGLIPELFFVPSDKVEDERKDPGSQKRVPNENVPLVWAQSLYLTGLMLDEGLVSTEDLDPLKMRRRSTRYLKSQTALVVLAENDYIKGVLAEHGVIAESIDDIKPMHVITAPHLVQAYSQVGANDALGLSGRPLRRLQSLATSQTYRINDKDHLCLSWMQSETGDYRLRDPKLIGDLIERELTHIRKHWINAEVAVFTFMMSQDLCDSPNVAYLYKTLREIQLRTKHESVGYASSGLAFRASRMNHLHVPNFCITPLEASIGFDRIDIQEKYGSSANSYVKTFIDHYGNNDRENCVLLKTVVENIADDTVIAVAEKPLALRDLLHDLYREAEVNNFWLTARYCYVLLGFSHEDLGDGLVVLSSRHMGIGIGQRGQGETFIKDPIPNDELVDIISNTVSSPVENALVQEMMATIGSFARTNPKLLDGLRTINLHNMLMLCSGSNDSILDQDEVEMLGCLSPSALMDKVHELLENQRKVFDQGVNFDFCQKDSANDFISVGRSKIAAAVEADWVEWRLARGLVPRFDATFLHDIWQSLGHTPRLAFGDSERQDCAIDAVLAQSSMTPGEESFARYIDQLVQHLHPAFYKSAIIETLFAYTQYCKDYPDKKFDCQIVLGEILESAAELFEEKNNIDAGTARAIDIFLEQSPYELQECVREVLKGL